MALNTTGPISIGGPTAGQSVNLEFGRAASAPTSMSQLYRGGAIVPNATANNGVPTSGAISLANLRGAVNRVSITVPITTSQNDYVFNTAKVSGMGYVAGITDVVFDISGGVVLSASSLGAYAGNVDASWNAGDTVRINNSGSMVGVGGAGGKGGDNAAPIAGGTGGPAFIAQRAVSLNNAGVIAGGGGGGGGGASASLFIPGKPDQYYSAGGGGGGGGQSTNALNSAGGARGEAPSYGTNGTTPGFAGGIGTIGGAGGGGAGGSIGGAVGQAGGSGGTRGVDGAGATGGIGVRGFAITGNGNISYIAAGSILGRIQ